MDFAHPHLAAPGWLWLAVLAPIGFAGLCLYAARARRRQLDALADRESQTRLLQGHSRRRRVAKLVLLALALGGIGLSLARPQWGRQTHTTDLQGEDIMVVLDCSRSMLAADAPPNRLTRAKLAILDFVENRPGGRVGLTAFAGQAFVQCPLTFDYDAFRECLMAADEKTIPVHGTDLARALDEAAKAMEKDARRKLMILITDGEDLEQGGIEKARELAENGVVIFAVGIGTVEGTPIQVAGEKGALEYVRNEQGGIVTSRLDENTLRAIALTTGGVYGHLGARGLIHIDETFQPVQGRPRSTDVQSAGIDRFYWFVAAVLAAMILESLIGTRRRMSEHLTR